MSLMDEFLLKMMKLEVDPRDESANTLLSAIKIMAYYLVPLAISNGNDLTSVKKDIESIKLQLKQQEKFPTIILGPNN